MLLGNDVESYRFVGSYDRHHKLWNMKTVHTPITSLKRGITVAVLLHLTCFSCCIVLRGKVGGQSSPVTWEDSLESALYCCTGRPVNGMEKQIQMTGQWQYHLGCNKAWTTILHCYEEHWIRCNMHCIDKGSAGQTPLMTSIQSSINLH